MNRSERVDESGRGPQTDLESWICTPQAAVAERATDRTQKRTEELVIYGTKRKGVGHEFDYCVSQDVSLPVTVRDRTVDWLVFLAAVLPGMREREWSKSVATGAVQHYVRFRA